jgi:hypothetical protein
MESETNGENRDKLGKFAPGNPGKPKGAVVKVSVKVREAIVNFLEDNIDQVQADFKALKTPKDRLQFIAEILPYAAPKLSAVQTEHSGEIGQKIEITWNDPRDHKVPDTGDQSSS